MPTVHNCTIRLLTDVPLSPNYNDTRIFASKQDQQTYFIGKTKVLSRDNNEVEYAEYTEQSYTRANRGYIRLKANREKILDCNYLMFRNYDSIGFWHYAFILSVDYLNYDTVVITFQIDVMQTWHWHYHLLDCFIERQHTESDNLFEHLIIEDVDCGDELIANSNHGDQLLPSGHTARKLTPNLLVILASYKLQQQTEIDNYISQGQYNRYVSYKKNDLINGVYCAITIFGITIDENHMADTRAAIKDILDLLNQDEIICIYECCDDFGDGTLSTYNHYTLDYGIYFNLTTLDGYRPVNKKLFNYPYNCIYVDNSCGNCGIFRFEDWNSVNNCGSFELYGTNFTSPTTMLVPKNYKGMSYVWEEGIGFSDFPQGAWAGDAFKAWWAQHSNSVKVQAMQLFFDTIKPHQSAVFGTNMVESNSGQPTGAIGGGGGGSTPAYGMIAPMAAIEAVNIASQNVQRSLNIASAVAKINDLKQTPSQTYGQAVYSTIMMATDHIEYRFIQKCIKADYARMIDDYFTMYGYSIKKVGTPNRQARERFTYIKTIGCKISGITDSETGEKTAPPASVCALIESIYDKGITFWRSGEVGDYDVRTHSNNPLT